MLNECYLSNVLIAESLHNLKNIYTYKMYYGFNNKYAQVYNKNKFEV